jgi:hypothetical protein
MSQLYFLNAIGVTPIGRSAGGFGRASPAEALACPVK